MVNSDKLRKIQEMYSECLNFVEDDKTSSANSKRKRGLLFEDVIYNLFEAYSLHPEKNIRHAGEQIDITITFNSSIYLIEAKWKEKISTRDIRDFFGKLWKRKCKGIFISHSKFSDEAIKETSEFLKERIIILFDKKDIQFLIEKEVDLREILEAKERVLVQDSTPFISISNLLKKEEKAKIHNSESFVYLIDTKDKRYLHINDLFVAPNEYVDIIRKLKKNNFCFIVGEPHIGKTFTALHILYSLYTKEGYIPKWYRFERRNNWLDLLINDPSQLLKSNHIIYFEDPVGKKDYEYSSFVARLGSIITDIRNFNCLVIFTSRELSYISLKYDTEMMVDISSSVVKMKEMSPSYTKAKMKSILEGYIDFYKPKWRNMANIHQKILDKLKNPHNLEYFVRRTIKITDEKKLEKEIVISKEIIKAFANEIGDMPIFESLFVLANYFIEFPKYKELGEYYNTLVEKLSIQTQKINPLRYCLEKFDGSIISRNYSDFIQFTHPSYEEAIEFSIKTDTDINSLFERIIEVTINMNDPKYSSGLIKAIIRNYSSLKSLDSVQNYILRPKDDRQIIKTIIDVVNNFHLFERADAIEIIEMLLSDSSDHMISTAGRILHKVYPLLDEYLKSIVDGSIEQESFRHIVSTWYYTRESGSCESCGNFSDDLIFCNEEYLCECCYELLYYDKGPRI